MSRAYSINNILTAKFKRLEFTGKWLDAVGRPQPTGSWFIYSEPKNGKTTFNMMISKYMTQFGRVIYLSYEEGISSTIQEALMRVNMREAGSKIVVAPGESMDELTKRLDKHRSPDYVVIDSIQFSDLSWDDYKNLKVRYPKKVFIYISHIDNGKPDGKTAVKIWRDANVIFRVEGFRAFPVSRFGGGNPIDIWPEKANEYWGE